MTVRAKTKNITIIILSHFMQIPVTKTEISYKEMRIRQKVMNGGSGLRSVDADSSPGYIADQINLYQINQLFCVL